MHALLPYLCYTERLARWRLARALSAYLCAYKNEWLHPGHRVGSEPLNLSFPVFIRSMRVVGVPSSWVLCLTGMGLVPNLFSFPLFTAVSRKQKEHITLCIIILLYLSYLFCEGEGTGIEAR